MIRRVQENLSRQRRAFVLLTELLEEEFSLLLERKPQAVSQLELSIQELMRQLADERQSLRLAVRGIDPKANRVRELLGTLKGEAATALRQDLADLDRTEQSCAVQAAKNQYLVMGLYDQSRNLLEFLHEKIQPKVAAYSSRGRMARPGSRPSLVSGRL